MHPKIVPIDPCYWVAHVKKLYLVTWHYCFCNSAPHNNKRVLFFFSYSTNKTQTEGRKYEENDKNKLRITNYCWLRLYCLFCCCYLTLQKLRDFVAAHSKRRVNIPVFATSSYLKTLQLEILVRLVDIIKYWI